MRAKPKVIGQSPLADAIAAKAEAVRGLTEKREALSKTERALVELEQFVRNAENDLDAAIAEASDEINEGEISLLSDRAVDHAERISRLKQQIEFHAKLRNKLKGDVNEAGLAYKRAMDALEFAKRPLLQKISGEIADEIDALESKSSALCDRLCGMSKSSPGGLDDWAQNAQRMMLGWAPSPPDDLQTNSARYHRMLAWTAAYTNWRKTLKEDSEAEPPEVP